MPAAAGAQEVLTEVSPQRMTKILTSMGLDVEEEKRSDDGKQTRLKFDLAGYTVLLFLFNDNTDAQLFVGFRDKVKEARVNEWNRDHRFARAYRDKDGEAVLETDIDFTGGVTEANIKAWVKIFRDMAGTYAQFVR
jgi:Putative bacterial sensory transduction regulator